MGEQRQNGSWQTIGKRELLDNEYFRVREDEVIRPDGKPGKYFVVEFHHEGVGVVAMTGDGKVYLVRQFRYPIGADTWEIPSGSTEPQEDLRASAARELKEEVGLEAASWTYLGVARTEVSNTTASFHIFLAEDLSQHEPHRDGTEDIKVRVIPLEDALGEIDSGEIFSANTIVALERVSRRLNSLAAS